MMLFMYKNIYIIISDLLKLIIESEVITVFKRGIELISFDINEKKKKATEGSG